MLLIRPCPFLCLSRSSGSSSSTLLACLQGSSEAKVLETALKGGQVGRKAFLALPDFSFAFLSYFPGNHCRCPFSWQGKTHFTVSIHCKSKICTSKRSQKDSYHCQYITFWSILQYFTSTAWYTDTRHRIIVKQAGCSGKWHVTDKSSNASQQSPGHDLWPWLSLGPLPGRSITCQRAQRETSWNNSVTLTLDESMRNALRSSFCRAMPNSLSPSSEAMEFQSYKWNCAFLCSSLSLFVLVLAWCFEQNASRSSLDWQRLPQVGAQLKRRLERYMHKKNVNSATE